MAATGSGMSEVEWLRRDRDSWKELARLANENRKRAEAELGRLRAENERLRSVADGARGALQRIHRECGAVCAEFDVCTHRACDSSYTAWAIADETLRTMEQENS